MPASASSKATSADDTTSLRHQQPELYLQPITRPVPTLDEAKEADASYRRLRDQWHEHMALAETTRAPSLRDPGLRPPDRRHARDPRPAPPRRTNAQQHPRHPAPRPTPPSSSKPDTDIHAYLHEAEHALEPRVPALQGHRSKSSALWTSSLEDIKGYGEWKDRALRLADAGEAILADPERYSFHLDDRPDDARRIRSSVATPQRPPSAATKPPSQSRTTSIPCPKTRDRRTPFTTPRHQALALAAIGIQRHWMGSPVLPEFSRVRDDHGPRNPSHESTTLRSPWRRPAAWPRRPVARAPSRKEPGGRYPPPAGRRRSPRARDW